MFDNENLETQTEQPIEKSEPTEAMEQPKPKLQAKVEPKESFKQLREQKEKAERERDELIKVLQQKQSAPEEDDIQLKPDDLVEGKHFNKKVKKLEQQLQQYQQQTEIMAIESQLKAQYPDFDKVVSKENIERLKEEYPDIAATIASSNDLKSKGSSAYTMIKKLIAPTEDVFEPDRNRAQANASKPKPLAAVGAGDSPMSRANAFASGLTDELKASLLKEMNQSRRGY